MWKKMTKVTKDNSRLFGLISRYLMCAENKPNTSLVDYYGYEYNNLLNTYIIHAYYIDGSRLDKALRKYLILDDELYEELQKEE